MFLDTAGARLHYEVDEATLPWIRQPATLVFCHGVATDARMWAGWLPLLSPWFRIVRFDTRGFGRSRIAGRGFEWSIDLLADDILAVARAAGAGRFHLVGESLGGTACLHLAGRGDAPLLSLACASTSHRGGGIAKVGGWREEVRAGGMDGWSAEMMRRRFFDADRPDPRLAWYSEVQRTTDPEALLDAADMLIGVDLTQALERIAVPVLLLSPDSSPFVPLALTAEISQRLADREVAVFAHARHGLPFSHAAECARAYLGFLGRRGLLPQGFFESATQQAGDKT